MSNYKRKDGESFPEYRKRLERNESNTNAWLRGVRLHKDTDVSSNLLYLALRRKIDELFPS